VLNQGTGTEAHRDVFEEALKQAGVSRDRIIYTVATGYGRVNYAGADKQVTEITCHAKGVISLLDGIHTVVDIGGQDSKTIKLDNSGKVINFAMNEKCAAGTGRFLEVMARVIGCRIDELSDVASSSEKDVSISSVCTVFAESEVISRLSAGESISDVARGAHVAIARRVAGLAGRVGCEPTIAMTGGVALNKDVVAALSFELGHAIVVPPHAQAAGAIGAGMLAYEIAGGRK
jgi:predicted CoA-substrate-specific enzyme activase